MRKSRFNDVQIIGMIKEQEAGLSVSKICRKHGISSGTCYIKSKYGGIDVSDAAKLRALEDENAKLVSIDPKTVRRDRPPDNADIRAAMHQVAAKRNRFGYRRLGIMLEREGFVMNHKKLYRIYKKEGLTVKRRRGRKRARGSRSQIPACLAPVSLGNWMRLSGSMASPRVSCQTTEQS